MSKKNLMRRTLVADIPSIGGKVPKRAKADVADPEGFAPYSCPVCESNFFEQRFGIMRRSAIISPNGQEAYKPIVVFRCEQCGWVLGSPVPEELKKEIQARLRAMQEATMQQMGINETGSNGDDVTISPEEEMPPQL